MVHTPVHSGMDWEACHKCLCERRFVLGGMITVVRRHTQRQFGADDMRQGPLPEPHLFVQAVAGMVAESLRMGTGFD